MALWGAIEAGGTKFVCGVGNARSGSLATAVIPTRDPDATFREVEAFFRSAEHLGRLAAMGVASFGPLDLNPGSASYGRILRTPKPQWEGTDLVARTAAIARLPIALETDVNAAALAEAVANGPAISQLAYVTVGTGVGVGIVIDGQPVHGLGHPEAGHMLPRRHPAHGRFAGICAFHADCLEGLASGLAIEAAWGLNPSQAPADHVLWEIEADYLAQLCATLFLTIAPMRIILGGGVMKQHRLFPLIRSRTVALLAGYFGGARTLRDMEERIVPPRCAEASGLIGAYILAERASAGIPGTIPRSS